MQLTNPVSLARTSLLANYKFHSYHVLSSLDFIASPTHATDRTKVQAFNITH